MYNDNDNNDNDNDNSNNDNNNNIPCLSSKLSSVRRGRNGARLSRDDGESGNSFSLNYICHIVS